MKVTDDNILDLAKAFVIIAVANGPLAEPVDEFSPLDFIPRITFLKGQRIEQRDLRHPFVVDAKIVCRAGSDETQTWDFYQSRHTPSKGVWVKTWQFAAVRVAIDGEPVREYRPVNAEEESRRGAVVGDARAERDSLGTGLTSGSEPQEGQEAKVSMRRLSASEVMDILRRFPEMVTGDMASVRNDTSYVTSVFEFSEVKTATLTDAFPAARFYKGRGLEFSKPPIPYLMAAMGDKRYVMPDGFNQLLFDSGLEVTDKSIMALARAFVVLAVGSRPALGYTAYGEPQGDELQAFPRVTFSDAQRIAQRISGTLYSAKLKVGIGEQAEEWYFAVRRSQFHFVSRGGAKGLIMEYLPVTVESLPGRGQLDPKPETLEQEK
jgi:hypothetical protein